ncbi:hypothetical protein ABIC89_001007 [Variovorax boronicumulans]|uniref:hypothetical protein n=1 Tax=Variovorax boronicumulans TaxID=436515 RepID=UPI00339160A2
MSYIHIHRPRGEYIGQVRRYGHQRWETIGNPCKTAKGAMAKAIKAMGHDHKRARVLFCADWYEPNIVMELSV